MAIIFLWEYALGIFDQDFTKPVTQVEWNLYLSNNELSDLWTKYISSFLGFGTSIKTSSILFLFYLKSLFYQNFFKRLLS